MKKYAVGADIGGSHISCAIVDLHNKSVLKESFASRKVDNRAKADEIFSCWVDAVNQSIGYIDKSQLAGVGFAMPGPFDYVDGVALFTSEVAKYENLYGINVAEELKKRLMLDNESEIRFMNDASAFAVAEAWIGEAAGTERSISITLGTGFGSAFIDGGIPVVERHDVPNLGCVWHLPFKDGIADDYFSTRWFVRRYTEASNQEVFGVKEIAERVITDSSAKEIFEEFGLNLGVFLGTWIKRFDAQTLVMGGNVSGAYAIFGKSFEEGLAQQNVSTRIRVSKLKEEAALVGSARMLEPEFWDCLRPLLPKM